MIRSLMVFGILLGIVGETFADETVAEKLRQTYLERLSKWVSAGGNVSDVQEQVVTTCGKLIALEETGLTAKAIVNNQSRETFDMHVDVCTKLTVNRLYPQPEFENPAIVTLVCTEMPKRYPIFETLCRDSKLGQ